MPIYKVYRSGVQERKEKASLAKWRLVALLLSFALLVVAAAMLLFGHH